jgi:hypothetical protein
MWRKQTGGPKERDTYPDWGRGYALPDDLSWIDVSIYTDTGAYRLDYENFAKCIPITRYLSLASGLGRQIVLAHQSFPLLEAVVSVDDDEMLHKSVKNLPVSLKLMRGTIIQAIEKLNEEGEPPFSMIAIENTPIHGITNEYIPLIKNLLVPGGLLAFVGDTTPTYGLWKHEGFTNLTGDHNWSMVQGLFQNNE